MSSDKHKRDEITNNTDHAQNDPISQQLRKAYQSVASEPLPAELESLLARLKQASGK